MKKIRTITLLYLLVGVFTFLEAKEYSGTAKIVFQKSGDNVDINAYINDNKNKNERGELLIKITKIHGN